MPRKLVRRRIRREFPRILYFSEVYDSSYCRDPAEGRRGRRMTGEVIWRSKLRCRQRGQVQVARSSSTPPTRKIYSFHIRPTSYDDPVSWKQKKKKKKKERKKKEYSVRTVSNEVVTIYFRSRAFRTRWIAFRISLTSSTNSSRARELLPVCADIGRKKWKIERVAGARSLMSKFFKRFFDWIFFFFFFFRLAERFDKNLIWIGYSLGSTGVFKIVVWKYFVYLRFFFFDDQNI